jgi:hypothetical protein
MTYLGVAQPNDMLDTPDGFTAEGVPIYERPFGSGFSIVAEGKPGPSRKAVGMRSYHWDPDDPSARPDIEIIVSRPLGNGSLAVCDNIPPFVGGVPAATGFEMTQAIADALNDLGCRFVDGAGNPSGRSAAEACTRFPDGEFRFAGQGTTVQFCAPVVEFFSFPPGDTLITVRLRDITGASSPPSQLIVRVAQ